MNAFPGFTRLALIAMFGLLASGGTASAQNIKRIHRVARVIEVTGYELQEEIDEHFIPSPAYKHLQNHTREIEKLAEAVQRITDADKGKGLQVAMERLENEINRFLKVVEDARRFTNIPPQAYVHLRREARYLDEAVRDMQQDLE